MFNFPVKMLQDTDHIFRGLTSMKFDSGLKEAWLSCETRVIHDETGFFS